MNRYKVKVRSFPLFFMPFSLAWAIATLVFSVHGFHRGDWLGLLTGIVFSVLCLCFVFLFVLNAFLAVTFWRKSKAFPQSDNHESGTGAV